MTRQRRLRIGTRGSALARIQAAIVRDALAARGIDSDLVVIETEGDRRLPDTPWGEGAFVGAIEDALVEHRIDVAVHSAKDVPTDEDSRLAIAAFLPRDDVRDVVVLPAGRRAVWLDDLPPGLRVGTDSPRRSAFLRALRPDVHVHPLHGNVDTRLRRLEDGATDALVLAAAGLRRLGRADRISFALPVDVVPPAPGQGALAVQVRADDQWSRGVVAAIDHPSTRRAVHAERAVLAAAGGGCRSPLGAAARALEDGRLELLAGFARVDGTVRTIVRRTAEVPDPAADRYLVEAVLRDVVAAAAEQAGALGDPQILVTRAVDQAGSTEFALVDRGLAPIAVPAISIEPADLASLEHQLRSVGQPGWIVVTSANAVPPLLQALERGGPDLVPLRGARWAAVGAATGRALRAAGISVAVQGRGRSGDALAAQLPLSGGEHVLLPRGDLAAARLPDALRERGAVVREMTTYRTIVGPPGGEEALGRALLGKPVATLFTSGSTVHGLLRLAGRIGAEPAVRAIPAVCIGRPTAVVARAAGFEVAAVAESPSPDDVAEAAAAVAHAARSSRPAIHEQLLESR